MAPTVGDDFSSRSGRADTELECSKLICLKSAQHSEHPGHKQGRLLAATHSAWQIRKLIFSPGNVFPTNNFILLCLTVFVAALLSLH